ncbi:MAG: protease complex subunit PrcB family protein [Chloroflexi bacterium]|nr:protease complex subunit PrcB family protein [Chloroflexota bacterium]
MPSRDEIVRPVAFRAMPNPEQWTTGDEPAYLVVTEKNWSVYYSRPPEGADFDTYIYLVASLGVKSNPGYGIRILRVERLKDRITTKVELKEPDPKRIYPQMIVHPIVVARVAKVNLEPGGLLSFVFVDQKEQLASLTIEI